MKNLLTLILLFVTFQVFGQNFDPVINEIDEYETILTNKYGREWYSRTGNNFMLDFYNALEFGTNNSNFNEIMDKARGFSNILKYNYISFIIDGWLYVMSYEDNTDANIIVNVYLFRKDVRTMGNKWERACGNPIFTNAKIYEGIFFLPSRANDGSPGNAIKLPAYKNAVLVLCGTMLKMSNVASRNYNRFVTLTPKYVNPNGSIIYRENVHCTLEHYPIAFTGIQDGGKIVNTVDNKGQKQDINIMMGDYYPKYNRQLNKNEISFDGGYGFSICYE